MDVTRAALRRPLLDAARGCYQRRPLRNRRERDLKGRFQFTVEASRGEITDVHIEMSTLGVPEVEACLREAAFGLDFPRRQQGDAAVGARFRLRLQPKGLEEDANEMSTVDGQNEKMFQRQLNRILTEAGL